MLGTCRRGREQSSKGKEGGPKGVRVEGGRRREESRRTRSDTPRLPAVLNLLCLPQVFPQPSLFAPLLLQPESARNVVLIYNGLTSLLRAQTAPRQLRCAPIQRAYPHVKCFLRLPTRDALHVYVVEAVSG